MAESDTRERLLEAAIEVFAEFGLDGARVQEIARRAGVTTGAIYAQFRGKADLLRAAIEHSGAENLAELLSGVAATGFRPDAILTALGSRLVAGDAPDWIEGLLLEGVAAARRDQGVCETLRSFLDAQTEQLSRLIEVGRGSGVFATDVDPAAVAQFCMALSLGMVVSRSIGLPMTDSGDWDRLIRSQVAALAPKDIPAPPSKTAAPPSHTPAPPSHTTAP